MSFHICSLWSWKTWKTWVIFRLQTEKMEDLITNLRALIRTIEEPVVEPRPKANLVKAYLDDICKEVYSSGGLRNYPDGIAQVISDGIERANDYLGLLGAMDNPLSSYRAAATKN